MIKFCLTDDGEKYETTIEGKKSDLLMMLLDIMEDDPIVQGLIMGTMLAYEAKNKVGIFDKMKEELKKAGPWPK